MLVSESPSPRALVHLHSRLAHVLWVNVRLAPESIVCHLPLGPMLKQIVKRTASPGLDQTKKNTCVFGSVYAEGLRAPSALTIGLKMTRLRCRVDPLPPLNPLPFTGCRWAVAFLFRSTKLSQPHLAHFNLGECSVTAQLVRYDSLCRISYFQA